MTMIHKHPLHPGVITSVNGTPVSVGLDGNGLPCVWFTTSGPRHTVRIVGTGWEFDEGDLGQFIGTWVEDGYVWHAFAQAEIQPVDGGTAP